MTQMQKEVDDYISQFKAGYFSPLANLARLTEEVGELSREINHQYGEKKKKDTEEENTIKAELGDNLFVLLCIANSLDIDMTESFNETMDKFNTRDHDRFERNKSLKLIEKGWVIDENRYYLLPVHGWFRHYCYRIRHKNGRKRTRSPFYHFQYTI